MPDIFLNYRRDDSADVAGRIFDYLEINLGQGSTFKDVDTIPIGKDFRIELDNSVKQCKVFLAVIGPQWTKLLGKSGQPRLFEPRDFVRTEIEFALKRDIPVVPVLVNGAEMPEESELPDSIKELAFRNAFHIYRDPQFRSNMEQLIRALKKALAPNVVPPSPVLTPEPVVPLVPAVPLLPRALPVRKAGDRHEITLPGGVKLALAYIPPGKFQMGSPASEEDRQDNETQHPVTLTNGFYMGVHPVTQAQYQAVMGTNPSNWKGNALPVEQVSWEDAVAFCGAVKQKTGAELRLPTEAEWEYAARGGTTTPFYWGSELNGTQANCDGNNPYGTTTMGPYLKKTTSVGSYAGKCPHPWGLTDVTGNLWEWCSDWYDAGFYAKPEATTPDPECKDSIQTCRVLRGGSWNDSAWNCRAAYRGDNAPAYRSGDVGFRVCVALD